MAIQTAKTRISFRNSNDLTTIDPYLDYKDYTTPRKRETLLNTIIEKDGISKKIFGALYVMDYIGASAVLYLGGLLDIPLAVAIGAIFKVALIWFLAVKTVLKPEV